MDFNISSNSIGNLNSELVRVNSERDASKVNEATFFEKKNATNDLLDVATDKLDKPDLSDEEKADFNNQIRQYEEEINSADKSIEQEQNTQKDLENEEIEIKNGIEALSEMCENMEIDDEIEPLEESDYYNAQLLEDKDFSITDNTSINLGISSGAEHIQSVDENSGDISTSEGFSVEGGVVLNHNLVNEDSLNVNLNTNAGGAVITSGYDGENNVDAQIIASGVGVNATVKPSDSIEVQADARASAYSEFIPEEGGENSRTDNISFATNLGLNWQISDSFNLNSNIGFGLFQNDTTNSNYANFGLNLNKEFKDGSSISLNADYVNENKNNDNNEVSDSLIVGLDATKKIDDDNSLTLGVGYTLENSKINGEEQSDEKNHKLETNLEYTSKNVTTNFGLDFNLQNPKEFEGRVGVKIDL